jgi:hypothetical protein
MNEREKKRSCDPVVPYGVPDYSVERAALVERGLADVRPFTSALVSSEHRLGALLGMMPGERRRWRCPCCRPSVVFVSIELKQQGSWRITHPRPFCPEFSRFDQAS